MKTGKIICYTLGSEPTPKERNRFRKQLLGYTDYSNKGQYRYERDGLLSEIPHIKPIRSVIVVRNEDSEKVIDFLKNHGAEVFVRTIILTNKDFVTLFSL